MKSCHQHPLPIQKRPSQDLPSTNWVKALNSLFPKLGPSWAPGKQSICYILVKTANSPSPSWLLHRIPFYILSKFFGCYHLVRWPWFSSYLTTCTRGLSLRDRRRRTWRMWNSSKVWWRWYHCTWTKVMTLWKTSSIGIAWRKLCWHWMFCYWRHSLYLQMLWSVEFRIELPLQLEFGSQQVTTAHGFGAMRSSCSIFCKVIPNSFGNPLTSFICNFKRGQSRRRLKNEEDKMNQLQRSH